MVCGAVDRRSLGMFSFRAVGVRKRNRFSSCSPLCPLAIALVVILHRSQDSCFASFFLARGSTASPRVSLHAAPEISETEAWQQAYELQVDRNDIVREQLRGLGLKEVEIDGEEMDLDQPPQAASGDLQTCYRALTARNDILESQLRNRRGGAANFQDQRDVLAKSNALFRIKLLDQQDPSQVDLSRFFGLTSVFYLVRAPLPLGLNMTKRQKGDLQGAFVVENVLPGGSASKSGEILPGDILQALTVVSSASGLGSAGSENQEFLATMLGSVSAPTQELMDATYVDTLDGLVAAIGTNRDLGEGVDLTLILERDLNVNPAPGEPLQPYDPDDDYEE